MPRMLCVIVGLCLFGCDESRKTSAVTSPPPRVTAEAADTEQPVAPAAAATKPSPPSDALHTPERGSPERQAITDALRPAVEKDLGQPVIFVIDRLAVMGGYAFLSGRPVRPDGKPIDYRRTQYQAAIEEGVFDDHLSALLRRDGSEWKLVSLSLGATDVPWIEWPEEHGAPKEIFPFGAD